MAIKALSLKGLRDWKQLQLFEREAATLRGLSHPGIPAYLDYFEEDTARDKGFFLVQVGTDLSVRIPELSICQHIMRTLMHKRRRDCILLLGF